MTRRLLAIAIGSVLCLTGCKSWGPITSTYNGHVVVRATGSSEVTSTAVTDRIHLIDARHDGNTVYARVSFSFFRFDCTPTGTCGNVWVRGTDKTTGEIQNRTKDFPISSGLDPQASSARTSTRPGTR